MIAKDHGVANDPPRALWLVRAGIVAATAMATALTGAAWTIFLKDDVATPVGLFGASAVSVVAAAGALLIRQIIHDLARREQQAARDAGHDLLSGLANRKWFAQWLDYELARHRREHVHFAVMYLDIDHFKDINDRHGHDAGDRMIKAVAQRILETLRPTDRLARFGGDEFAILQTGVRTIRDAEALATRILESMRSPFRLGKLELHASVSIGIALCPDNASEREDLMKLADLALYRAKQEGRDRLAFFDARMGETLARRRAFGVELAGAIESDSLALDYQPVFRADDRVMVDVEARLRWPHPQRGLMDAKEFLSVAEERGLLLPLGVWALRRACQTAQDWAPLKVSLTLAPVQFNARELASQILEILNDTGFDPARLDLCITEACLLEPKDAAIAGMTTLRREGVRFTLVGYGAGVCSMNYLRRFPISRIKLDRVFAEAAPNMSGHAAVLHSVVHLGRALGLTIAADGVETPQQARYLTALGCHELQGRLLSPYVNATGVEKLLASDVEQNQGLA